MSINVSLFGSLFIMTHVDLLSLQAFGRHSCLHNIERDAGNIPYDLQVLYTYLAYGIKCGTGNIEQYVDRLILHQSIEVAWGYIPKKLPLKRNVLCIPRIAETDMTILSYSIKRDNVYILSTKTQQFFYCRCQDAWRLYAVINLN